MTEIKRRRVATNGIELSALEAGEGPSSSWCTAFRNQLTLATPVARTRSGGLPRGRARYARLRRE